MVRSIDTIRVRRVTSESSQSVPTPQVSRPTAGAGGLAGAAVLLIGAFFLATRPNADNGSLTDSVEPPPAATAPRGAASQSSELGPPQLDEGQSVEQAIILDRPLASSLTQDGSTGSPTPTIEPIAAPKPDSFTTRILNGSGRSGSGAATQQQLIKLGFHITDVGTAVNAYEASIIYYAAGYELQAKTLKAAFGHDETRLEQNQIARPADVLLVIGVSAVTE